MAERYRFQLWQDGIMVAGVDAPDLDSARREIMHYATVYSQDGPCEIRGKHLAALRPIATGKTTP